ncbi:MAG: M20 family metallopeptidase [Oscillospiraceae bacterium]|nr:M20 family metallopeptidase [Oscillospiraceae bacterium]
MDFVTEANALQGALTAWRRELHQIPEVGTHLPQTVEFITKRLDEMEIPYQVYEDISCVAALIGSGRPCFLLRGDMDALQVEEEAEVPFRSVNGCMHGCGHDMHATMLLGAAKLLKEHEKELKGTVKLLFQSGEEIFQGAKAAVAAGVLEAPHVDAAFAAHVIGAMPMGVILTGKEAMSAVYGFKITVTGKGGHGSMPEQAVDPINAGVQIYLALQSLIAREIGGTEEAVLTIGQFHAGDVANVIPERAVLQGTLRTFDRGVRQRLIDRMGEMVPAVAAAYRCTAEIEVLSDCPSVVTDDAVTAHAERQIKEILPDMKVIGGAMHGMGSEDFAFITERVPSAYYMMGAGVPDQSKWVGQHNPKVMFNEDVLPIGAAIYAQTAAAWLEEHSK